MRDLKSAAALDTAASIETLGFPPDAAISEREALIRKLIVSLGEDPQREGLLRTPHRVAKSFEFLTSGYAQNPRTILRSAIFESESDEMVIVSGIEFASLCEHHLLPFLGTCDVAYIPNRKIVGLSKVARVVDACSRRLQVQERLVSQIASAIHEALTPRGVAVVMRAKHMCMMLRGVQKQGSVTVTSEMLGLFRRRQATRNEFLRLTSRD